MLVVESLKNPSGLFFKSQVFCNTSFGENFENLRLKAVLLSKKNEGILKNTKLWTNLKSELPNQPKPWFAPIRSAPAWPRSQPRIRQN
jgi:hypothetical protein